MTLIPTARGLILLLAATLPLAAASIWPAMLLVAAGYALVALGLLAADLAFGPRAAHFAVRRHCDSKLSLGADNAVEVQVCNNSGQTVTVWLRDEFPAGFLADAWRLSGVARARDELRLRYHLKPLRRGDYRFGDLNLRVLGVLGLVVRQMRFPAVQGVKVYPNLLEVRRYDLLAMRGQHLEVGLRQTRLLGRGTEFERLREYQSDDDYRRINWKATARRGRPIAMEYETDRSQNVMLVLDTGRMLAGPVGPLAKLDYAINAALMLAYVAVRGGDRVGLLAYADRIVAHLPPRQGKRQFIAMLEALYAVPEQHTESNCALAFRYLQTHNRKRSLVIVFTDLFDADVSRPLVNHLAVLSTHHLTMCVTIADPSVTALAAARPVGSRAVYERAVAEDLLNNRRQAFQALRRRGVIALDVPADRLTASVVNRYLELKARTRL